MDEVRVGHVRLVYLHEIHSHEDRLSFGQIAEVIESRFLDVFIHEGNPDYTLCGSVHVSPVQFEFFMGFSPALPKSIPVVTLANIARSSGLMSGNHFGSA